MSAVDVAAKLGNEDDAPSASVKYDFGDNLDEAVTLFGAEVVYSRFVSAAKVDLQALIRRHLDAKGEDGKTPAPKTEAEIQALIAGDGTEENPGWKPGVASRKRKTPMDKFEELLAAMSPADKAAALAALQGGDEEEEAA